MYGKIGVENPFYGKKHTKASKIKNSEAHKGNRHSPVTKQKMSISRKKAPNNEKLISFNGTTQNLKTWAEQIGINPSSLKERFDRGWSIEKALTTSKVINTRKITFKGETSNLKGRAKKIGISSGSLCNRLKKWPVEKALTAPPLGRS